MFLVTPQTLKDRLYSQIDIKGDNRWEGVKTLKIFVSPLPFPPLMD